MGANRTQVTRRWSVNASTAQRIRALFATARVATALFVTALVASPGTAQGAPDRIVAIGDLHGDLLAARTALRLAGAIDSSDHWIGGKLIVVQTGDLMDRGDDEVAILALLRRVREEAQRAGGAVHVLNGNHELMQAYFDFRYVTDSGFRSFVAAMDGPAVTLPEKVTPIQRGRALAFRPGGPISKELATHPTMFLLDGNAFVHGGILPAHAKRGIEPMNEEVRAWLRGDAPQPTWIKGDQSPVWTRLYSKAPDAAACETAREALALLKAKRMIVGHSIQKGGITSYCDGAVWAIDVGMSAFSGGKIQVLEIRGDSVRPLGPVDHPGPARKKGR